MAFDEVLAQRVRTSLSRRAGIRETQMFGGLSFLVDDKMCCGLVGDKLVLRLGEPGVAQALTQPHTAPMTFTGRPMKSMVYVLPAGTENTAALKAWVVKAVSFTRSVPANKNRSKKK